MPGVRPLTGLRAAVVPAQFSTTLRHHLSRETPARHKCLNWLQAGAQLDRMNIHSFVRRVFPPSEIGRGQVRACQHWLIHPLTRPHVSDWPKAYLDVGKGEGAVGLHFHDILRFDFYQISLLNSEE